MADKRVRQAIYYAFDRKTLLETVFQRRRKLLWIDAGFDPNDPKLEQYEFNPDKAKELIAAAAADGKFDQTKPICGSSTTRRSRAGTRSPLRSRTT